MAVAKIKDITVYNWNSGSATQKDKIITILATDVAKIGDRNVDITTQENKIVNILAVAVITAKTGRLLAKNVTKKNSRDKNVENNPF